MTDFSNSCINWQIPTFLIVTGASRGLGQTIAIEFCKKLTEGSSILLLARDKTNLILTEETIKNCSVVKTFFNAIDLALPDSPSFEHLLTKCVQQSEQSHQQVILVHNAGSLGDISKTIADSSVSSTEVKEYFDLNLYSFMFLTTAFLKAFKTVKSKLIINISSLAATTPFRGWNLYCTGKAAREMFLQVLAQEEKDSVTVLNYAPGPLLTDMLPQILHQALPEIRQQFQEAQAQNQLLTCQFSVQRLISVLERSKFKSGEHVDVFDLNY